jgi:hypothetical protein
MPEVWRMTAIADMVYAQSCLEVLRVTAAMLQFFRLTNIPAFLVIPYTNIAATTIYTTVCEDVYVTHM